MDISSLALAIALGAGVLSFASPCVLPLVPAYVGYLAGAGADGRHFVLRERLSTFCNALAFVLGFSLVFILVWVSIGLVGYLVRDYTGYLRQAGGVVLIFMGLHLAGIFRIPFLYREMRMGVRASRAVGLPRSFLVGVIFASGWTPCVGPILGSILGLAMLRETLWQGVSLLVAYSAGLGIPFLLTALAIGHAQGLLRQFNRHARLLSRTSGILVSSVGVLMVTNLFARLPQYFTWGAY